MNEDATITRGMSDTDYHQLPSLSASGAKLLLQEGGPAKYRWWRDHPEPPKDEYEFGSAVHTLVLGVGAELVDTGYDEWRTKAAKDKVAEIRESGRIPLRPKDYRAAHAAAQAVREHRQAAALLSEGEPEVSINWIDQQTGIELRARPDWLRPGVIGDLKTTNNAAPMKFGKSVADFGYEVQEAFYRAAVRSLGLPDPLFVFVCVERTEPYLVSVVTLDHEARQRGERRMRHAIEIFRDCTESKLWPGYDDTQVHEISLPAWAYYQETA